MTDYFLTLSFASRVCFPRVLFFVYFVFVFQNGSSPLIFHIFSCLLIGKNGASEADWKPVCV